MTTKTYRYPGQQLSRFGGSWNGDTRHFEKETNNLSPGRGLLLTRISSQKGFVRTGTHTKNPSGKYYLAAFTNVVRQTVSKVKRLKVQILEHRGWKCKWFEDGASFCYCAYILRITRYSGFLKNLPTNTTTFLRGLRLCGKVHLSKGHQNPERKLGVTMHSSEITEHKFGKKLPYILCILNAFFRIVTA